MYKRDTELKIELLERGILYSLRNCSDREGLDSFHTGGYIVDLSDFMYWDGGGYEYGKIGMNLSSMRLGVLVLMYEWFVWDVMRWICKGRRWEWVKWLMEGTSDVDMLREFRVNEDVIEGMAGQLLYIGLWIYVMGEYMANMGVNTGDIEKVKLQVIDRNIRMWEMWWEWNIKRGRGKVMGYDVMDHVMKRVSSVARDLVDEYMIGEEWKESQRYNVVITRRGPKMGRRLGFVLEWDGDMVKATARRSWILNHLKRHKVEAGVIDMEGWDIFEGVMRLGAGGWLGIRIRLHDRKGERYRMELVEGDGNRWGHGYLNGWRELVLILYFVYAMFK